MNSMKQHKQCKQCGKLLPSTAFRKYYGGRKGNYKYCLTCERINNREKYLMKKDILSADETAELNNIHDLWQLQRMNGLQPPHLNQNKVSVAESVDDLLSAYDTKEFDALKANKTDARTDNTTDVNISDIPVELQIWLTADLTKTPEYYQDEVYEKLREKYRPVLEINQQTLMPVYDDTYKDVLNKILDRFDDYEDNYDWSKED